MLWCTENVLDYDESYRCSLYKHGLRKCRGLHTVCGTFRTASSVVFVQVNEAHVDDLLVVRSSSKEPKEAFAAAMQSWRERCEKCVCLQGDYVEK